MLEVDVVKDDTPLLEIPATQAPVAECVRQEFGLVVHPFINGVGAIVVVFGKQECLQPGDELFKFVERFG